MQVWCDWQVTLCDPHLSALEVRFSRRCAIQIDVYLYLYQGRPKYALDSLDVAKCLHRKSADGNDIPA